MKTAAALAAGLAVSACIHAPASRQDGESLAAAETAFAAQSVREDMRAAFLAHFADDGLLVRDGWTPARAWLEPRTAPPIVLDWRPVHVEVAASGDMGLSTGPWRITARDPGDTRIAHGQFVSIWKRAPGGPWKVAVDLGIGNPGATHWDAPLELAAAAAPGDGPPMAAAEAAFALASATRGEREAYRAHGAAALRHYRDGITPHASLERALASAAMSDARIAWHVERSETARSGELGYVTGRYADAATPGTTAGYYLRVWRRERGAWKVVLDVVNAAARR
jgi:ketosteroid isomerase-like protein